MDNSRSTVLACVDGSIFRDAVIDYGAWVSRTVQNPLKLLHNIEYRHTPISDLSGNLGLGAREGLLEELTELEAKSNKILLKQGSLMLEYARARADAHNAFSPSVLQLHGSLSESLIDLEDEIRVLVIGIRGEEHENKQHQIGAQLESVIRAMHRPVLVVNRPFSEPPKRIMLAYDQSDAACKALEMVATSPLYKGMQCHLVHVSKSADASPMPLNEATQKLENAGLEVITQNLSGSVESTLIDYQTQHGIDMTVMGAFGRSRLREFVFGSVTVNMLCDSQVPLLLLR